MRRSARRGVVLGAGAAVLSLGGLLAACGGGDGDGYVATGAAGAGPDRAGRAVGPTGDVELVPLDGRPADGSGGRRSGKDGAAGKSKAGADGTGRGRERGGGSEGKSPDGAGRSGSAGRPTDPGPSHGGTDPGRPGGSSRPSQPPPASRPGPLTPAGPAKLAVGEPERKPADKRWCEEVTVTFRNTGGAPVRSGTVTFETHIIGALGVDWATVETTEKLPVPIGAGRTERKTWPVCVDWWRVPLGMHVETRDVSVKWR